MSSPTERPASDQLAEHGVAADLKAALAARRELGRDMDDLVLEAFLAGVEERIDQRVQQQLAQFRESQPAPRVPTGRDHNPTEIVGTSMGVAVPLMIIAGIFAHGIGAVIAVMAGVVIINLLYLIDRWISR